MTRYLGSYNTATDRTHVRFQFSTHAAAGGNVAPSSAFEAADLRIYRAADSAAYSATQRSSAAGITMTSPFDSLTGVHDVDIDLTENTDAGFYAAGYRYSVVLAPDETVDSQTITGVVLAEFEIGPPPVNVTQVSGDSAAADYLEALKDNAITGTADSGTTTTMVDAARTEADDFWNGQLLVFTSGSNAGLARVITDFTASSDTVTFSPALPNAVSAADAYEIAPAGQLLNALFAEPTGVPGATISLAEKISWLYMALRNKVTVTATKKTFFDDGDAAEWEKDVSDSGTEYTESEANSV